MKETFMTGRMPATGALTGHVTIETTFDETVLRDIVQWIHARSGS